MGEFPPRDRQLIAMPQRIINNSDDDGDGRCVLHGSPPPRQFLCQMLHTHIKYDLECEYSIVPVLQTRMPRLVGVSAGAGLSPVWIPGAMLEPSSLTASQEPPAEGGEGTRLSSFYLWPQHPNCQL